MAFASNHYTDIFPYDKPPMEPLETIPEFLTEDSIAVSPPDFSDENFGLLLGPDVLAEPVNDPATPYNSPRLPRQDRKAGVRGYISNVLQIADDQRARQKRVRFEDLGASPRKRAKMAGRLEKVVYDDDGQDDMTSDGDLIRVHTLALHGLQQDKAELVGELSRVLDENKRLVEMNQRQTDRRMAVLNDFVKRRGMELMKHGDFLLRMADEETSAYL